MIRMMLKWRGVLAGAVIEAAELTMEILKEILEAIESAKRKIAIGIANETPYEWEALNSHLDAGTSDVILPEFLKPNKALLYSARKVDGPTATGTEGVIVYYMKNVSKTLAILFSNPFDHNIHDTLWNVKVYPGRIRADEAMHKELDDNPIKGDNGWHCKAIGEGFYVKGFMTSSSKCILEVKIKDSIYCPESASLQLCYTWQIMLCFQFLLYFLFV